MTVSVTAMLTTDGSTFLTSGAKLSRARGHPRRGARRGQHSSDQDRDASCPGMRRAAGLGMNRRHDVRHLPERARTARLEQMACGPCRNKNHPVQFSVGFAAVLRPVVLRITPSHVAARVRPGAFPECGEVGGHGDGTPGRRQQRQAQLDPPPGEAAAWRSCRKTPVRVADAIGTGSE